MVPLSEPYAVLLSSGEIRLLSVRNFIARRITVGMTITIRLLRTLRENPVMSLVADFGDKRKIVAAKAAGILPVFSVLVES